MIDNRDATQEKKQQWYVYMEVLKGHIRSVRFSTHKNKRTYERSYTFNTLREAIDFMYENTRELTY